LNAGAMISGAAAASAPAFLLWFLALLIGYGVFAGKRAHGTTVFQVEQPLARGAVWNA